MDREEAIKVLKEIIAIHNCELFYVNIISPNENESNNTLSVGYQLHVKGVILHSAKELEEMVTKYGLAVKEDKDKIIIYKPLK